MVERNLNRADGEVFEKPRAAGGVRLDSKKKTSSKKKSSKKAERPAKKAAPAPWTFPKNTLEDAITIAKAIEDKHGGNPMKADLLAKAVAYNRPNDWRFLDLLRSANLYGLVSGSGEKATVELERIGQDVVAPSAPQDRKNALLEAFHNVPDFKRVSEFYGSKRLPEDEYFINTLARQFEIPRDRCDVFAEVFRANLAFLRSFDVSTESGQGRVEGAATVDDTASRSTGRRERPVREFLDTCFVMMPFGTWFDKYYQEIYVPAIKDAGLEPVRADELFTTGSVMEQIWDQIGKARILLAELTDKNANVFYELGLSHGAVKPVVFTAARVDDVPFDLRHLRVIVYDVREPEWAPKLKASITEYLRNTLKDPSKSIPHPFRNSATEEVASAVS